MSSFVVALDVGGTSMKGGLVSSTGQVLLTDRRPTPRAEGPLRVVEAISAFIDALARAGHGTPAGVGLAVPGLVTSDTAVYSANIGWKDVPATDFTNLNVPVRLGHDVRTGGLAESVLGAGRAEPDFLFLPIGTGIAGAVIIGHHPYGGSSGWGGEIGHIPVFPSGERCACGQIGCLETYASAASVARRYAERLSRAASLRPTTPHGTPTTEDPRASAPGATTPASAPRPATPVSAPASTTSASAPRPATPASAPGPAIPVSAPASTTSASAPGPAIPVSAPASTTSASAPRPATAEDVVALAMRGDPDASAIWDDALEALSLALASYTLLMDPSSIIIGGGLAEAGPALFDPLAERLQERLTFRTAPPLRRAALGVNAGMLGAALLGWQAAGVPDAGASWSLDVLRSPSVP
ncbi:ROK family protein [Sphaerisporangium fuscum]|uniref:ROK family protein n=1 Tax=Sphaerisporangium fuscum TaxID=2835868 RepID=UPI0027E277FF|nr:ROK family protein [Sphaerisporangium fuscum]